MFGGGLFPALYVVLVLLAEGGGSYALGLTFTGAAAIPVLFWIPGTVGLLYRHREPFGWIGRMGGAVLLVTLTASIVDNLWLFATQDQLLEGTLTNGILIAEGAGALLFGGAIAYERAMPRALAGGLLLALGLPASFGLLLGLSELGVTLPAVLAVVLFTLPFGAGWFLLCYDLVSEPDRAPASGAVSGD